MAKTEDIEARLAAYVDGDIDEAARAEIEKHLAGNAQHRQLIAELMQQRDILRGLPREAAPQEVAEAVNSQLERAVLLGDIDADADAASLRIGHWPQIRAIAAVLLFTASLAAVIYYLLPSANERPTLVDNLRTMQPAVEQPLDAASQAAGSPTAALAVAPTTLQTPSEQQQRATLALGDTRRGIGAGEVELRDSAPGASVSFNLPPADQVFRAMASAPAARPANLPVPPETIVVCALPTPNPDAAAREISQYLATTTYAWEVNGQQQMPLALNKDPNPLLLNQDAQRSNTISVDNGFNGSNGQSNFAGNGTMSLSNSLALGNNVYDPRLQYERQLAQQQLSQQSQQQVSQQAMPQPGVELSKTGEPLIRQQMQQAPAQQQGQQSQSTVPAPTQEPMDRTQDQQVAMAPEASAPPQGFAGAGGGGGRGGARGARGGRGGRGGGPAAGAFGGGQARAAAPQPSENAATGTPGGSPASPAGPVVLLQPTNGSLNFGVIPFPQQEQRIVVKQITRRQASEIQTVLDVIRVRNQSPNMVGGEPLTLTLHIPPGAAASLNGFPSVDDFTASRMRELSAENVFAIRPTTSTADVSAAPATQTATTAVVMASPTTLPTLESFARLRGADFSLASPATATVDLKSQPTTNFSGMLDDRERIAAPTTQSTDELLDLVILVQPIVAAPPPIQPATQPAQ